MAFRILDDDLSDTASITSSDTSTITESSEASEQASADMEEEMEHLVDPYQFEPVASDSDENSYSVDSEEDSSERLLNKDW